jgi:hypothetical protein
MESIICRGNKIYSTNSNGVESELSRREFLDLFPSMCQSNSGKITFFSNDGNTSFQINESNEQFLSVLGVDIPKFNSFKNYSNDVTEIIQKAGLEKEYCLLFGNNIVFHSFSKDDIEKYRRDNPWVLLITYEPILI